MEEVLASPAFLRWQLLVRADERVADRALDLSFECSSNVLPECDDAVNQ